ncbi:protein APCDD1-like [Corythoichthys intestinalis]|uniref:protein APCDD1-like n=1 Tax=Corythoichthys intestinalis TaxID=161448 RepID=UPI0025A53C68|nr:protein APCDD1-like [Corythoichthys intestinalis]
MYEGRSSQVLRGVCLIWQVALMTAATGSTLWEVPTTSTSLSESLQWQPNCHYSHHQDRVKITSEIPPKLDGTWLSTRCEVRPGPEFLTRAYTFQSTRHFQALQHYYTDSGCENPAYSLVIRGKLRLRQASWITRGATEADHHLSGVAIIIHSLAAKQKLASRLPLSCVGPHLVRLVPGKPQDLYNTRAGRGCLAAMGFSMMELDLVRVETQHHDHGEKIQRLFLGDIHTDWTQRTLYRPTGFQQPLQSAMHHIHPCPVCALVYRSTEHRPPVLPHQMHNPISLAGRWFSQQCETRPTVLFLTREFHFDPDQHAWEGIYRHYLDSLCTQSTFTLKASGHYAQGNPSVKVPGATEFVFKVTEVRVTAEDESTAKLLNRTKLGKCGQSGEWKVGVEQGLSSTHGCTVLGIKLPHKEYELFKVELDHRRHPLLYVGERPTDGSSPDRPSRRATSFQAPLMLCSGAETQPPALYGSGIQSKQVQVDTSGSESVKQILLVVLGSALCSWLWIF